jgi:hypothetical protein
MWPLRSRATPPPPPPPGVQLMERMYESDLIDALRPYLKSEKVFMDADDWRTTPVRLGESRRRGWA